ncbi:hypothetical protein [Paenibacillus mesotrionivorans]|uniref:Uncharacterized protein n=1 Tax=Paenibacillus mesotrionivorans TaxID=3160968 RepID=A0ACC7NWC7_9BACL
MTGGGIVFQEHRLLTWLKVKEYVRLGLFALKVEEKARQVEEYLKLEGFGNAYPKPPPSLLPIQ